MKTHYKDHIILILGSGGFKAHLVTAGELYEHAFNEMGEDGAELFVVVNDYVTSKLEDYDTIGWTELNTDEKSILKLSININNVWFQGEK